ncbi:DNA-binding transcriptional activator of the SARP family [Streptomyces sp. DvalAA-14]|uniref:AfsR/SARP family transcriptional regulator n=1 Tax=unclassified Streptomyces TaxID=2593676 RepID=UPI00081B2520|nr:MULTISPECIES: AfsR/SARP family transcriptional regulator [unclassified Streptomyces]MYS24338.1 tetratricopeptide repeat protein [Streptomyces sp. SID4948]SCE45118.1 DNA-binding transcriptional activator of the SARP family [Streptomyces sp. DvalAA-14]
METRTEPGGSLRFAVLGPVRAWRGDEPIGTGAPQQRALLAALLLRGGRTATASELLDAVWGENPPNTALAALRSYAFRLRKALGPKALITDSGGYALHVATDALDSAVVERLAAEADRQRAAGDPAQARELLGAALEQWHGEPLAGLPGPYAETQRSRLAEWHIGLIEARLELDLELGAHAEAVSELTALSADHPLRERLRALLMLALYRSGRQAEALGVYADTRRLLADELGIDPSAELAELHQRILEADPGLAAPAGTGAGAPEVVRPAQLPATVADFTGRAAFVAELGQQLAEASEGRGVMAVSAVAGIGGVGKTTLAVHVAHEARDAFPDGQLYVDLQGTDPRPAEPETVLGGFLRALGIPNPSIPDTLAERAALYRSTLDSRRVLVLLDNAYDAAQVRSLLPGTPGCAALITSRVRMVDLAGAHLVDLDVMSPEEALKLFTRIVGEERAGSERQAALDVVGACGFLPLAIRIAASRLAARRTWTVSVLANKLADQRRRLDELRAGDLGVKATFALGYGHLSPAQARAFRLLSLADGPDISLAAASAVLDLDPYATEELLEALVDISLIESAAPARYRFHDLLRLYARECAERDETADARCQALSRQLDFYLASAAGAYALENPGDRMLEHLAATARPGLAFASREESLEWLFSEAQGLLAAVQQAADGGCEGPMRRAVDLLLAAQDLMESGVYARQYEQAARALVGTAHDCGDPLAEGRARVLVAQRLRMMGRFADADDEARRAMVVGLSVQDPVTCSYAPNLRGSIAHHARRYEDCAEYHRAALAAFRADGNRHGEASALSNLSRAQLSLGDSDAAVTTSGEALAIYRDLGAGFRLGNGLYTMSIPLTAIGRLDDAHACLTEALQIFRDSRQQFWEGVTLFRLAEAHLASGRQRQSASHAEQALVILREVGGEWRTANALTVLGRALAGMGQLVRAHACWHDALGIYSALDSPERQAVQRLLGGGAAPSASSLAV